MNILYLTNHLNIGGITSYVLSLGRGLNQRGHRIHLASSAKGALARFDSEDIIFKRIPIRTKSEVSPKVILSLLRLINYAKRCDIDIIHSNSRVTQVLGSLLKHYTGIPHISTCHGFFKRRLSRRIFPCWGDKVIAISDSVKEHLTYDFGVKEENIRLVYSGIEFDRFKLKDDELNFELRQKFHLKDGLVIGIIARLSEVKGHIYLIEAMKSVADKFPHSQLLIVGEGDKERELKDLTRKLNLEKKIIFMPNIEDTASVLSAIDVFVMPSLNEGLGLGLMEAMAMGLAVIGSEVGGIKNLIQNGYSGLLVKPADVNELSGAIIELLNDPGKRAYLGKCARNFIRSKFSLEKMCEETEKVYLECLSAD